MRRRLQAKGRVEAAARPVVGRLTVACAVCVATLAMLASPALAQVTQNLGGASVTMAMSGRRELVQPVNNVVWHGPQPAQPQQTNAQGGADGRRLLHARANDAPQPPRSAN